MAQFRKRTNMVIPSETALTFFMASIILALVPGPDNIFVLTQSALHGRISGLWVTLELCKGLIVHTTAVALGGRHFSGFCCGFFSVETHGNPAVIGEHRARH